ncbi:MAG: hypothetical protein AB7K24_09745 [Gemmataceae bacterium]
MIPDFPAAHSMDTTWFAVDRDGHVGMFDSWEAGAVPTTALNHYVEHDLPEVEAIADLAGRTSPWPGYEATRGEHRTLVYLEHQRTTEVILFLTDEQAARKIPPEVRPVPVRSTAGVAVLLQLPERADWLRDLHEQGQCLGCYADRDFRYRADGTGLFNGFFVYHHHDLFENWVAGPYGRLLIPVQPLHVDQLPPADRIQVLKTRFAELSFAAAAHVQPVEHFACESWGLAAISSTGRHVRPIETARDYNHAHFRSFIDGLLQTSPQYLRGLTIDWPKKG